MIGLASFLLEQNRKEINIRKILGADFQNIIAILAKKYMKCLALAAVIAWPIGYFVMSKWLENFSYKTGIGIEIFILSGFLAFIFAFCTVSFQSIKAAVPILLIHSGMSELVSFKRKSRREVFF